MLGFLRPESRVALGSFGLREGLAWLLLGFGLTLGGSGFGLGLCARCAAGLAVASGLLARVR